MCWPARAPARPAPSPVASPTSSSTATWPPARFSPSPSPPAPRGRCAPGCAPSGWNAPAAGTVQARTFHAAALRQLRYFWPQVVGDTPWQLLERKFAVVGAGRLPGGRPDHHRESVRDLAGEIEWAKASLVARRGLPRRGAAARHHRDPPGSADQVAAVYTRYEELKSAERTGTAMLDFDDLLLHTAAALEGDERRGRGVPGPLPLLRGRRVPGRHPAAAARARRLGRRARRPHRGRGREPDHLLLHRGDPALPARLLPSLHRGRRGAPRA